MYAFTLKKLCAALASGVAVVTFANDCVAGSEVCYPRLPCFGQCCKADN